MNNSGSQDFNPQASPFNPNLVSNGNLAPSSATGNGHRPCRSGDLSRGGSSRPSSRASLRPSRTPSRPSSRGTNLAPIMQPIPRYGQSIPYAPYFPGHYGAGFSFAVPMPSGIEYATYSAVPTQLQAPNRPSSVPVRPVHQPVPPQPIHPQAPSQALPQAGGRQLLRVFNPKTNQPVVLETRQAASAQEKKDSAQTQAPTQRVPVRIGEPASPKAAQAISHLPSQEQSSAKLLRSLPVREPTGPGPFGFKVAGNAPFPNKWSWDMKAEQVEQDAAHKAEHEGVKTRPREALPEAQLPVNETAENIVTLVKTKAANMSPRQEVQPRGRSSSNKNSPPYPGNLIAIGTRGLTQEQLLNLQRARSAALAEAKTMAQQEKKRGDDDTESISSSHNSSTGSLLGPQYPLHLQLATQRAMNTMAHAAARERATVPNKVPENSAQAAESSSAQDMTKAELQERHSKSAMVGNEKTGPRALGFDNVKYQVPVVVQAKTYPPKPRPGASLPYDKVRGMYIPNTPAPLMSPASAAAAGRVEGVKVTPLPPLSPIRKLTEPLVRRQPTQHGTERQSEATVAPASIQPQPQPGPGVQPKPANYQHDITRPVVSWTGSDPAIISAKPIPSRTVANPNAITLPPGALTKKSSTITPLPQFFTPAAHSPALAYRHPSVEAIKRADSGMQELHHNPGPSILAAFSDNPVRDLQETVRKLKELQQEERELIQLIHTKPAVPVSLAVTNSRYPSTLTDPSPALQIPQAEPFPSAQIPQPASHTYHKARSTSVAIETKQFHQVADYFNGQRPAKIGRYVPLPDDWQSAYPMIPLTPTGRRRTDREMARYLTKLDRDFYSGAHLFGMSMHQVIEEVRIRHIDALFLAESLGVSRQEYDARLNQYANLSTTYKQPSPHANMTIEEVMAMEKRKVVEPMVVLLFRQLLLHRAEEGLPASHKTWRSKYFGNSHPAVVRIPQVVVQEVVDDEMEEREERGLNRDLNRLGW